MEAVYLLSEVFRETGKRSLIRQMRNIVGRSMCLHLSPTIERWRRFVAAKFGHPFAWVFLQDYVLTWWKLGILAFSKSQTQSGPILHVPWDIHWFSMANLDAEAPLPWQQLLSQKLWNDPRWFKKWKTIVNSFCHNSFTTIPFSQLLRIISISPHNCSFHACKTYTY